MAYTALYREWRPKKFNDVVGQKHITTTLKNQIKNNRIAHAYLFCGTRGTGKTSTAKLFAKAVNCLNPEDGEPCNKCEICKKINEGILIDVTELDAASNNGIEKIREIIDNVKYPPSEAKFKVYILDEVHMLSIGAVNAFLKTLEEPPERVIFILATTDPQKLPITILSRCQRFDFTRIKNEDILKRLREIVSNQGVLADDASLELIARMSDGAMRDALSILDQAIAMGDGKVEYNEVVNMLGLVTNENLIKITDCLIEKNVEKSIKVIDEVVLSGKDINGFIRDLINHMRNLMMVKVSKNPEEVIDMSKENIQRLKEQAQKTRVEYIMKNIRILQDAEEQSKWVKQNRIYLELAIIKICKQEYDTSPEILLARINTLEEYIKNNKVIINESSFNKKEEKKEKREIPNFENKFSEESTINVNEEQVVNSNLTLDEIRKNWRDVIETVKGKGYMLIYTLLEPGMLHSFKNGVLNIRFQNINSFSKTRLEREQNKIKVEEILKDIFKEKIRITFSLEEDDKKVDKEQILKKTFGENLIEIIDE